ncbi:universal stress protein UspA [Halobacteriales archaeon QS_4_62_28]|nr:MAG: universal stress protein UspA [Halobacteriales archaeon QS_4_62_28]
MRDRLRREFQALVYRFRRFERYEIREFRAWIERTTTIVHFSVLVFVPLLIAFVTYLANSLEGLSFLLFPPLASGAYTLFSSPESRYASPSRFVGGLTLGAACGWVGLAASNEYVTGTAASMEVTAFSAGLSVLLVGLVTWLLDLEEPSAFSTALLGLLVPPARQPAFLASVFGATLIVSGVFAVWRREFYERRATVLYQSVKGDDHVLVPMVGKQADATAMLGGRIASAHDAGKVVLLDVVADDAIARAERTLLDSHGAVDLASPTPEAGGEFWDAVERSAISDTVGALETRAGEIETKTGVPCEVVVAVERGSLGGTILQTATEAKCDLIATPYAQQYGRLAPFIHDLFRSEMDVLVHRSAGGQTRWHRVLVPVRRASDVAHSMIDFSMRLIRAGGQISVCTCLGPTGDRWPAESMLADLVEPFDAPIETRVSRDNIVPFLAQTAPYYDLVMIGASRDRSAASRLVAPPTFEEIQDLGTDVAIVDRG